VLRAGGNALRLRGGADDRARWLGRRVTDPAQQTRSACSGTRKPA
jgi:hypothetical protein